MRNMADEIKQFNENLKLLEQEMSMKKNVISLLSTRIVDSKRQCCVNQQYLRQGCLEIPVIHLSAFHDHWRQKFVIFYQK